MRQLRSYVWDPSYRTFGRRGLLIETPYENLSGAAARLRLDVGLGPDRSLTQDRWDPARHTDEWLVGLEPSTRDVRFATQMVYAVAQWTLERFRRALGREPDFAFSGPLILRLFDEEMENAYYDRSYAPALADTDMPSGAIRFGWFRQQRDTRGASQAGVVVHTALSHDVIVHEVVHALVDGVRPHFMTPSNPDVSALHEGLADLVTIFSHFAWPQPVETAIRANPEEFSADLIRSVARQFGQATAESGTPLRTVQIHWDDLLDETPSFMAYTTAYDPHTRGQVLVSAVFEAFVDVYRRKAQPILALRRRGDQLSDDLIGLLARLASRLADQFLDIVIRALDFTPPVDPTFGEYLRALITADRALVVDDPWGYREALVYAFRRHRIPVQAVDDLSEASLQWQGPEERWQLQTAALRTVVPALVNGTAAHESVRTFLDDNAHAMHHLGLVTDDHARQIGLADVEPPRVTIEQVRLVRRAGPDRASAIGAVVVLTAVRQFAHTGPFRGGCVLVIGADGTLQYVIRKHVDSLHRYASQLRGEVPQGVW